MARACRAFKFVPLVELVSPSPRARDGACTCWDPRAVELSSLPLVGLLVSACACGVCRSVRSWQVKHGGGAEVALAACCIVSSTHASLNLFGVRRLFFSFLSYHKHVSQTRMANVYVSQTRITNTYHVNGRPAQARTYYVSKAHRHTLQNVCKAKLI